MATFLKVATEQNKLFLSDGGELNYDLLVFAAGAKTNFFGNQSIQNNSFSLKGIDDAVYMRNELIKTFEKASIENDSLERKKLLSIVIVGGGATGVELAGMMAEFKNHILNRDYPELKNEKMTITLLEAAPNLLSAMSQKTHAAAYRALESLGIIVKLNTRVNSFADDKVLLSNGELIDTKTLIWAAGVKGDTFEGISTDSVGKGNRLLTDAYNCIVGYSNIYAIGDSSIQYTDDNYPNGHPQLAQPAIQQGKTLAKNLVRLASGKEMKPFKYFDRGDMAVIGRKWAVADLFKHRLHVGGLLGLLGWLFLHLISLANYNNKIKTFYGWLVAYATHDQVLRMIFHSGVREQEKRPEKTLKPNRSKSILPKKIAQY